MSERPTPLRFLPEANLYVAAVRGGGRQTGTLALLTRLVEEASVELVGDGLLVAEFERYAGVFPSPTAQALLLALLQKLRLVEPHERFVSACAPFMEDAGLADLLHAAVCLETGAVLISDDQDFRAIAEAGLIHRLSLSEAIRKHAGL